MDPQPTPSLQLPRALLAAVMAGAMLLLAGTLLRECQSGEAALQGYLAAVQQGAPVSVQVGGAEAEALTAVMRRTTGLSVSNFQAQSDTACYWVRLQTPEQAVSARLVLSGAGEDATVTAASLVRECLCPEDAELPCHLRQ